MGKIVVRDSESADPTIFKGRMSRRVISPERDNSSKISLHKVHRWAGISNPTQYTENDELLYILEEEGWIFEGDLKHHLKSGYCVFICVNDLTDLQSIGYDPIGDLSLSRYRDE